MQVWSAQNRWVLALWFLFYGLTAAGHAAPIKVWSIDFNDPAEPTRWQLHRFSRDSDPRFGSPSEQVQWGLVPRSATTPSRGKVLQFSANSKLSVETYFSIFRAFPPEFQPDPSSDLILEWEWRINDTDLSGAVSLVVLRARPDGSEPDECLGVAGHTRFTAGWEVLFDPPKQWIHHRLAFPNDQCPQDSSQPKQPIGIILHLVSPIREVVNLGVLKIEEWPRGALAPDPILRPHRPPPPDMPFQKLPFSGLGRSTAGAAEDLDGDGLPELLVLERRGYMHLYRPAPDGTELEEITESAGLAQPTMGTGAMFLDLDTDRDQDLLLTSEFDVPRFFENLGNLRFRERRLLDDRHLSFWYGVAADDVDRDGNLDLFFTSPLSPTFLFLRGHGGWHFKVEPLFDLRGLARRGELNFSASFADMNDDGWPDLFLGREYLFLSFAGHLELRPEPWPATNHVQTEGGLWADLTGDGRLDLLILRDTTENAQGSTRLLEGKEAGTFTEITEQSDIPPLESAEVALAEDFDNDADLDLYLCQRERPNYLLLNDGRGRFSDATEGSGFSQTGGCDGALAADLNGDGGLDLVILRYGSPPALLFNQLQRGNWLGVIVEGKPGTAAIGARVRVLEAGSGTPILTRWVRRGQGFGSVGPTELRFGLGSRQLVDIDIRFPAGRRRLVKGVQAGSSRLVCEDGGDIPSVAGRWALETLFPVAQSLRRYLSALPLLPWLIAGFALLASLALLSRRFRALAAVALGTGALLAFLFGSIPGRGLAGSLPALWGLGVLVGVLVPATQIGIKRLVRSLRRRDQDPVIQSEDLIRFTLDFRHSGIDNNALLSIHRRVQNLFLSEEPHPPFLSTLRELAASYPQNTGARLKALLSLSGAAFPVLSECAKLAESERRLEDLLGQLSRLEGEPGPLRSWQLQVLLALQATETALEALLHRIDLLCSCDIRDVLREACAAHAESLQRAGVLLQLADEAVSPLRALITREALLLILDNLFTNALAALAAKNEPRIAIQLQSIHREILLRFKDNGPGVAPELAEKIFQYGFSTRAGGKGYGLPRSRELLGHFGGGMTLEAGDEQGTIFLITLRAVSPK